MNTCEIVKLWNVEKGTRYPVNANGGDSSLVKSIDNLKAKIGEQIVEEYYNKMTFENKTTDIWSITEEAQIRRWANNRKVEARESEIVNETIKKTETSIISMLGNELIKLMGSELANKVGTEVENRINQYVERR